MARLSAACLVPGVASGPVALLSVPLSLWGGFDPETGRLIDVHHPQHGMQIAGTVLVMPGGRGSSSSSSVLLESARLGTYPRAVVLAERDPILVVGALVAEELYGVCIPVVSIKPGELERFEDGAMVRVTASPGTVTVEFLQNHS